MVENRDTEISTPMFKSRLLESFLFEQELNKDTLFRNLIRLASYACVLTFIGEMFVPLDDTYLYTVMILVSCLISLLIHAYGKTQEAYHSFVLLISIGFTIIALQIDKLYPSTFNLYSLGIVFVIAFIKSNRYAIFYLIYLTSIHVFLSYSFLAALGTEFLLYEWTYDIIHIAAYNMAVFLISLYFIKFVELQREKIALLESEGAHDNGQAKIVDLSNLSKFESLSMREKEVALLIGDGMTNKQIGEHLYISIETVKTHRKKIKAKLEIKSNKDFFLYTLYHRN